MFGKGEKVAHRRAISCAGKVICKKQEIGSGCQGREGSRAVSDGRL